MFQVKGGFGFRSRRRAASLLDLGIGLRALKSD